LKELTEIIDCLYITGLILNIYYMMLTILAALPPNQTPVEIPEEESVPKKKLNPEELSPI